VEEITSPNLKLLKRKRLLRYLLIGSPLAVVALLGAYFITAPSPNKPCGCSFAKTYVGSMNHSQEVYYLEHGRLASSLEELDLSAPISQAERAKFEEHILLTVSFRQAAFNYVIPKQKERKSWVGGVFVTKMPETGELSTLTITCEAKLPGFEAIAPPINAQTCGSGTEKVR
jgi:hypothetical protein